MIVYIKDELFVRTPLSGTLYEAYKNANRGLPEEMRMRKGRRVMSAPGEPADAANDLTYENQGASLELY
jgi:hypothetical protein